MPVVAPKQVVKTGDLIYLRIEENGFLHTNGLSDLRIGCLEPSSDCLTRTDSNLGSGPRCFNECIFQIQPKLMYDMTKAYEKVRGSKNRSDDKLEILKQQAKREKDANANILKTAGQNGFTVKYGQVIQLQHVNSGKFLVARPRDLAEVDKSCLQISLVENGSSKSWFVLTPRYKTKSIGGDVQYEDFLSICRSKYSDQLFHISECMYKHDIWPRKEINLQHNGVIMKIFRYCKGDIKQSVKILQVGRVYRIYHLEAESFLTSSGNIHLDKMPYLRQKLPDSNLEDDVNNSIKALFVLEFSSRLSGEETTWSSFYRFRHLCTGKYLTVESNENGSLFEIRLTQNDSHKTLFKIHPVNNDYSSDKINALQSFAIEHLFDDQESSCWLHSTGISKKKNSNKKKASLLFAGSGKRLVQDSFRFVSASESEVHDAMFILSNSVVLSHYESRFANSIDLEKPMTYSDVEDIFASLTNIIFFFISTQDIEPLLCEGIPIKQRQIQARESKLIDLLYFILQIPGKLGVSVFDLGKDPNLRMAYQIHKYVNKAIVNICQSNLENKLYIARMTFASFSKSPNPDPYTYMEETIKQLGSETGAKRVYCTLYIDNPILLHGRVDEDTLNISCKRLLDKGAKAVGILYFLSILCSCNGEKISKNQELILSTIYDLNNTNDYPNIHKRILIDTYMTSDSSREIPAQMKNYVIEASTGSDSFAQKAKPIGYSMVQNGLPNITISWCGSSNWKPHADNGLYFTAPELGLSSTKKIDMKNISHVSTQTASLDQVVWVLEPSILYPKMFHGKTWQSKEEEMIDDPEEKEKFDRLYVLASFYDTQLKLFSELLRRRSLASIEILSSQFDYALLIGAISNPRLPYSIRNSFSLIMHRCWVERFPHEPMLVPKLVHMINEIPRIDPSSSPTFDAFSLDIGHPALKSSNAFVSYPYANKFAFLQAIINDILEDISEIGQSPMQRGKNQFISSMLHTLDYLVVCGFYPDMKSFKQLCQHLITALDGRTSVYNFEVKKQELLTIESNEDPTSRYEKTDASLLLMSCKTQLAKVLQKISAIWENYVLIRILSIYKHNNSSKPLLGGSGTAVRKLSKFFEKQILSSKTAEVEAVQDLSSNEPILSAHGFSCIESVFLDSNFDLRTLSNAPLVTICLDLIMYQNDDLLNSAFSVLVNIHSTRERTINYLSQIILLEADVHDSIHINDLQTSLLQLRYDIEIFQCPSIFKDSMKNIFQKNSVENIDYFHIVERIKATLVQLTNYCRPSADVKCRQNILRHFNAHKTIMQLMLLHTFPVEYSESNKDLQTIQTLCVQFLKNFLKQNSDCQDALYKYVPCLMERIDEIVGVGEALVAIFSGNKKLCEHIPDDVIWSIAKLIERLLDSHKNGIVNGIEEEGFSFTLVEASIDFFKAYVAPNGIPLKRNQTFLFRVITSPQFHHVCCTFLDEIDKSYEAGSELISNSSGFLEFKMLCFSDDDKSKKTLSYHLQFVELISFLCHGKNCRTEIGCQQLLPINFILTVLLDPSMPYKVKIMYGQFLSEVYFDTDLYIDKEMRTMPGIWSFLIHCSSEMSNYLACLSSRGHFDVDQSQQEALRRYIFTTVLSVITNFFSYVYDPFAHDLEHKTSQIVDALKADIRSLLKRGKLSPNEEMACRICGVSLGLFSYDKAISTDDILVDSCQPLHRKSIVVSPDEIRSLNITKKFNVFQQAVYTDEKVQEAIDLELNDLVHVLSDVEALTSEHNSSYKEKKKNQDPKALADRRVNSITLHALCERLILYIKRIPLSDITVSAMEIFTRMVSSDLVTDEDRRTKQPIEIKEKEDQYQNKQIFIAQCGAAELVVSLIASNVDESVVYRAVFLGIEILNGGNRVVQDMIYSSMINNDEKFFYELDSRLLNLMESLKTLRRTQKFQSEKHKQGFLDQQTNIDIQDVYSSVSEESSDIVSGDAIFRIMQLLAEGHNVQMQEILLNQQCIGNSKSYCLIQRSANYLELIAKDELHVEEITSAECELMKTCWDFLVESVQGPCRKNQEFLVDSSMVEVFRNTINAKFENNTNISDEDKKDLLSKAVKAMVSLLEGRLDNRVQLRLQDTLEKKPLQSRIVQIFKEFNSLSKFHEDELTWDEEFLEEGFDILTLAQAVFSPDLKSENFASKPNNDTASTGIETIGIEPKPLKRIKVPCKGDFPNPMLYQEAYSRYKEDIQYFKAYHFFKERHCSVEFWWGGDSDKPHLERVYFPMPSHCRLLPYMQSRKDRFMASLDYGSDLRLTQFVKGSVGLEEEMQHIEVLSTYTIYNLMRPYIPLFKKSSFALALLMNLIMLISLHGTDGNDGENVGFTVTPASLRTPMQIFGTIQTVLSICVLVFMMIVRIPLVYQQRLNAKAEYILEKYKIRKKKAMDKGPTAAITLTAIPSFSFFKRISKLRRIMLKKLKIITKSYDKLIKWAVILVIFEFSFGSAYLNMKFQGYTSFFLIYPFIQGTRVYLESSVSHFGFFYCLIYEIIADQFTLFYIVYLITAILGRFMHPIFYGYHLLDLVIMSEALQNVVKAVTRPRHALIMTTIMGLFFVYFFTLLMFFFFPEETYDNSIHQSHCSTLARCFLTVLHRGLLMGGGVGDYLTSELGYAPDYATSAGFLMRTIYDLGFFVVVLVLLLNIIFGIIIDTFSELRSQGNDKAKLMQNQCFICGIDRQEFDNYYMKKGIPNGFSKHISEEHNMWNYLFFLVYLRNKERTECSGSESYIIEYLENDDLSWFPRDMAKCLDTTAQESIEEQVAQVKTQLGQIKGKLSSISTEISSFINESKSMRSQQ